MANPTLLLRRHHPRLLLDTPLPPPPDSTHETATAAAYVNETNFDTNMVIILAALLCALIGALGLNSMVRCAMRCSRRFSPESQRRTGTTGLKKRALRQIPVAVYGSGVEIPATECPICLGEFEEGEKVRVLPKCNHGFHVRCIDTWLVSHSSCPNCRHSLLDRPTNSSSAGELAPEHPRPDGSTHQGSTNTIVIPVHGTS